MIVLLLMVVLLAGCTTKAEVPQYIEDYWADKGMYIIDETPQYISYCLDTFNPNQGCKNGLYAFCDDGIVCYGLPNIEQAFCFDNQKLIDKYCNYKIGDKK